MIGAIIGDIVGSRFEFDNFKSKDFEMFDTECDFTDDSVMTLAIAKALQSYETITDMEAFKKHLVKVMHEVGMRYPHCGYGGRFYVWMMKNHIEPYNSYGNGSAMRVSPVGWFATSLEECEALAAVTAEVTHNHPEGVKGAVAVAGAIYLARTGHCMDEIKEYIKNYYTIDFTLDEIGVFGIFCGDFKVIFRLSGNLVHNRNAESTSPVGICNVPDSKKRAVFLHCVAGVNTDSFLEHFVANRQRERCAEVFCCLYSHRGV